MGEESRYKESLTVPANNSMTYTIPLEDIGPFLDLKQIVQVNFFRWKPKKPGVFFLDDVRLTPKGDAAEGKQSRIPQESPQESSESLASAQGPPKAALSSGDLVLGDFETENDLKKWKRKGVSTFLSEKHAVRGKHSVKPSFSMA